MRVGVVRRIARPDAQIAAQVREIAEQMAEIAGVMGFLREHKQALLALPGRVDALASQLGQVLTLLET